MQRSLTEDLVTFVESGVSIQVGTRDSSLVPEAVRGFGASASTDRRRVTVFIPVATSARTIANLNDNRRIAVCFSRIQDHRTIQIKGRMRDIAFADDEHRRLIDTYRAEFGRHLAFVGLPQRLSYRLASWPCHAVHFDVETIWVQTPGPGAGEALRETVTR